MLLPRLVPPRCERHLPVVDEGALTGTDVLVQVVDEAVRVYVGIVVADCYRVGARLERGSVPQDG